MNKLENVTSAARIHFHIQSWYDEVEDFDSAEFGSLCEYTNFSIEIHSERRYSERIKVNA
ncbi:hypothetical protein E2986_13507 [Frieseomelitta varia]|uniref:Uncharacterized protein n=1 Tax=Frieseomelitta varia TaxID=561572 RepID=A0A833VNY7_9HYME|nr:hypothetical protein E2986_13507 [Frieseomelitta varia]